MNSHARTPTYWGKCSNCGHVFREGGYPLSAAFARNKDIVGASDLVSNGTANSIAWAQYLKKSCIVVLPK